MRRLRVVTWNVHHCRGLDGRTRPERVARVLQRIGADVVALQEVSSLEGGPCARDHAGCIARRLALEVHHGTNRTIDGARYGNAVLTALASGPGCNYDISVGRYERRGCLRVDIDLGGGNVLHVFNVHLGVSSAERRGQAELLERSGLFDDGALPGPRVLVGDFNEWNRTVASRFLAARLARAAPTGRLAWPFSYPGLLPITAIDRVYHDRGLRLRSLRACRSYEALLSSDHVPLVAEFDLA